VNLTRHRRPGARFTGVSCPAADCLIKNKNMFTIIGTIIALPIAFLLSWLMIMAWEVIANDPDK